MRTPQGKAVWDITMLKVPIFGSLMRKTAVARFCATFSSLLHAGVPVLESLDITKETVNNVVVARAVESMAEGVRRGETMTARLSQHPIFPAMVSQMMSVGEETGALDADAGQSRQVFSKKRSSAWSTSFTSLLEPLLIVILGGCVGTMVVCLYLPMFKVDTLINGSS